VTSREDASADVTGQVNDDVGRLATARALRRSLLRELADSYTTSEIDHVRAALRRNEAVIVADQTALRSVRNRVSDSAIAVTVSAPVPPAHHHSSGSGFTLHRALHDAGRVLVVAAGVAVIALAVLVPFGVLVAIGAWVWAATLRRRREAALES
jgi:Flp pilus assembly protein TadB